MLKRLLTSGLLAGFIAAIVYTLVQAATLVPLIVEAERYETAHHHAAGDEAVAHEAAGRDAAGHEEAAMPAGGIARLLRTGLANLVTAVGFAFLLVAGYGLSGRPVDGRSGLLWGIAGFAAFSLAPALGLPPELPGAAAADLAARQAWWIGTAAATALGLALGVFARPWPLKGLGLVLLAVPHLVGAPQAAGGMGAAPPELAARFAVLALATSALFWLVLGWASGMLYRRAG